jgi:hypothetical protein
MQASVTMGDVGANNLALASRKVGGGNGCRCRPTRGLRFHLAYDRLAVFNGLLFIWGAFKL